MLEIRVEEQHGELEEKVLRRKSVENDMMWLLQKGIVRVVDKVVGSFEFLLEVRRMKVACMATNVEGGK